MKKIKVIKPIFGLEVNDVLTYSEEYDTWDFSSVNEDVQDKITSKESKTISIDDEFLSEYYSYFIDVVENKYATVADDFTYIKPLVIKAYPIVNAGVVEFMGSDYNMKEGDFIIRGIDGSLVPVSKKVFDKLFKVIK